ncbi:ATP-binding cassette domain-containing protein [uncultured Shimia sp.]|uniref:ATP-binding cassette domain-containing protein n=1 Tax=uncultured Shimia sp. TaxID=573152 RepID=UPI0025DB1BEA|nr:ATP-binding cassette domain-containing protein [uncultured Shimia sp.]
MSHDRALPDLPLDAIGTVSNEPSAFRDRTVPMWTHGVSFLFSFGGGICLLAVAIFVVFFYELVAQEGQRILAVLLALGTVVPILGILIFDVGHARALSGYRHIRKRNAVTGQALVAVLAGGVFGFLHPLMAAPFVIGGVLSWLLCSMAARWTRREPMWEFLPQEAASFLSGRDQRAIDLANAARGDSAVLEGLQKVLSLGALIAGFAVASWLSANEVINIAAIATIALVTYWSVDAFFAYFRQRSVADPERFGRAEEVVLLPPPYSADPEGDNTALVVHHLSVRTANGASLLSDVSFRVEPGEVIGLSGDSFSGKSLLMQALHAPHDLTGLQVEGYVALQGASLWGRTGKDRPVQSVMVPPGTLAVPGGGAANLSCFCGDAHLDRARKALQSLVFTADTVSRILNASDVRHLSRTEQKALSLARALALRPGLFLIDRPEDGASESLLAALGDRLRSEARLGHTTLLATENRQLLERCDRLLMMQNGRVIEFASTAEIRARLSSGWSRFVTTRELDNEEALDAWLCSQFRRDGDEGNRRAVCMVANEMLAVACQAPSDNNLHADDVSFEFKHFVGQCQLRLIDPRLALSSGAMQKARVAADTSVEGERLSPLAKIMRDSLEVETGGEEGHGYLQVTMKTYDPRLQENRKGHADAPSQT